LHELKNENSRLKSSVKYLEDQTNKDRYDHGKIHIPLDFLVFIIPVFSSFDA
jgi:hypothetical protein